MPALFVFLFKVNIALLLFCAGYYLVLRRLTFYSLNRVYLVTAIIFATIYPIIDLSNFAQQHETLARPVQNVALYWQAPAQTLIKPLAKPDYWYYAGIIFWTGAALLGMRLIVQLVSLLKLYRRSVPAVINDHAVRLIDGEAAPFSFWRSIYVNPANHTPADLEAILQHEQVHVNGWHTIDILLAELSSIFYWFNPGIWLMKRAVRENIEFITDRKILNKGFDTKTYQYSLVNVSFNNTTPGIVNHFNISTIKKRIIMMNAKRSSKFTLTRYAFVVPSVVVLLLVFSLSKAEVTKPIAKKITDAIRPVTIALQRAAKTAMAKTDTILVKELTLLPTKKANGLVEPASTVYAMTSHADTGKKIRIIVNSGEATGADSMNFVLNGKKIKTTEFAKLNPSQIVSINIVSSADAKRLLTADDNLFFDNDKKIVFVTTSDSDAGKKLLEKLGNPNVTGFMKAEGGGRLGVLANNRLRIYTADTSLAGKHTVWAQSFKGNTIYRELPDSVINKVYKIQGTQVINGIKYDAIEATRLSGTGKITAIDAQKLNGVYKPADVIALNSLRFSAEPDLAVGVRTFKSTGKPGEIFYNSRGTGRLSDKMIIIDGKIAGEADLKKISGFDIDRIDVRADLDTLSKYGEKAKNGVVFIYTKKSK